MKAKRACFDALSLLVIVALQSGAIAAKPDKPNVLFVVCDDLNTHVSPSGYAPIQTPALSRLAAEGLTFRRSYCQYPVCGPSRASFLSGLYPETTRVLDNRVDIRVTRPGTVSLPQRFKESGYQLGEHFMWGKVTLFEECARTPLVVRVPGMTRPGAVTQALGEHVDFYPTLLELCGLKPDGPLQGRSFVSVLKDPQSRGKEVVYTVVTRGKALGRSIRSQRWRYAQWGSPDQVELYDLEQDPYEYANLAKDPDFSSQLQHMEALFRKARQRALGDR